MLRYATIRAVGNVSVASSGGGAVLWTVNVNTPASTAVLSIYDGTSSSGALVATIDASVAGSYAYGVYCDDGIFAVLSGASADVTIGYS